MRINFNYEGASTHSAYLVNQREMGKSLLRLSTGMRILEAADDAAGLFIADQLSVVATGLEEGNRNIRTGISALRIAENASGQIFERLRGIYARATRAANDVNDPNARAALQREISNLRDAIQKIGTDTEYNGIKLLDGTFQAKYIHYGARMNQVVNVSVSDLRAQSLGAYAVTGAGSNHNTDIVSAQGSIYSFNTSSTNSLVDRLNSAAGNFVINGTGEYVRINGTTVYQGGATPALVDAYTLTNNINNDTALTEAGFIARAQSYTTTASNAYNTTNVITVTGSGNALDATIDLNFYVGSQTFSITNFADIANSSATVNYSLSDLVNAINTNLTNLGITDVQAVDSGGRLQIISQSGRTWGVEVAVNITASDTDNDIVVDFGQLFESGTSVNFSGANTGDYYVGGVRVGGTVINASNDFTLEYNGVSGANQGLNFDVASSTTPNSREYSTTGGNLMNFINGSLGGERSRFVLGAGEYVSINGVRVYQNTSATAELIDSAKLASQINQNDEMRNLGVEAKATNVSLGATYQNTVSANGAFGGPSTFDLNLRFYIGDGSKTFSFKYASATTDGAGNITVNTLSLDELISQINSNASTAGANISAMREGQKLKLVTSNGETIAIELAVQRTSGTGSATFNVEMNQILQDAENITLVGGDDPVYSGVVKVGQIDIAGFDAFTVEYSGVSDNGTTNRLGFNFDLASNNPATFKNLYSIDVTTNSGAETAMMIINKALQKVDTERSQIGAVMNNLQSIFDAQKVAFDNTKEAENVIRNTDYAEEMSRFTTLQIKMQSAIAMLAQANQMPQLVLQLLR